MKIEPLITIITAAFRIEGLKEAIKSIDAQTYKKWHHIIVNDNQPDIREWGNAMRDQWLNENRFFIDLGVRTHWFGGIARNVGTVVANTYLQDHNNENRWIVYHDDDNLWYPEHLQTLVNGLNEMPEAALIGVDCEVRGKINKDYKNIRRLKFAPQNVDIGQLLYKANLFRKYGLWDPCPRYTISWDWELIKKMYEGEKDKVKIISKATFIFWHKRR